MAFTLKGSAPPFFLLLQNRVQEAHQADNRAYGAHYPERLAVDRLGEAGFQRFDL